MQPPGQFGDYHRGLLVTHHVSHKGILVDAAILSILVSDALANSEPFLPPYWFSRQTVSRWMQISQQRLNARLREAGVNGVETPFLDVRNLGMWLMGEHDGQAPSEQAE